MMVNESDTKSHKNIHYNATKLFVSVIFVSLSSIPE